MVYAVYVKMATRLDGSRVKFMKEAARLGGQASEDAIGRSIRMRMPTYANGMDIKGCSK